MAPKKMAWFVSKTLGAGINPQLQRAQGTQGLVFLSAGESGEEPRGKWSFCGWEAGFLDFCSISTWVSCAL